MADEEIVQSEDVNTDSEEEVVEKETEEVEEEVVEEEEPEHEKDIPYSRFKEVVDQKNTLQNLTETLSQLVSQNRGLTPHDKDFEWPEDVTPEVRQAVERYYDSKNSKQNASYESILGAVLDKLDEVKSDVANPAIKKHSKEVDSVRNEYSRTGVYITRQQAFEIAQSRGLIKKVNSSGKQVVVNKSKAVISKEKTNNNANSTKSKIKKPIKEMTDQELDQSMDGVKF